MYYLSLETNAADITTLLIPDGAFQLPTTNAFKLETSALPHTNADYRRKEGKLPLFLQTFIHLWSASALTAKLQLDRHHPADFR